MAELRNALWSGAPFGQVHYLYGWCPKCGFWGTLCQEASKFWCHNPNCGLVDFPDGDLPGCREIETAFP